MKRGDRYSVGRFTSTTAASERAMQALAEGFLNVSVEIQGLYSYWVNFEDVSLTPTQWSQLKEARDASDGVVWMSEHTGRVLVRLGLVERLHPTCAGARLTDAGRALLTRVEAQARAS